jgi:hypothetical protein
MSEISELLDECRLVTQNFHIVGWLFPLLVVGFLHQNDGSILRSYCQIPD